MSKLQPTVRLIARLDVKSGFLIKGRQLEGLRKVGSPTDFALDYYHQGVDEIVLIDPVASLYGREPDFETLARTARSVFVPITVGGGVSSEQDFARLLHCGADKVAINSHALARPKIISELAAAFGSQSVVISIQARRREGQTWEAFTHGGREPTGRSVLDWAAEAEELGAGEVLITSVDREGTGEGFDLELVDGVLRSVSCPVVVSGGFGKPSDLIYLATENDVSGIAIAGALHYGRCSIETLKSQAAASGIRMRSGV